MLARAAGCVKSLCHQIHAASSALNMNTCQYGHALWVSAYAGSVASHLTLPALGTQASPPSVVWRIHFLKAEENTNA